MILEFPHQPPTGYHYEFEQFNTRVIRIWLCNSHKFDYNHGAPTQTVWGFYSAKKNVYYAPINSKMIGKEVNIDDTRKYTAMQLKQSPLEKAFV